MNSTARAPTTSLDDVFQMAVAAHGGGQIFRAIELYDLILDHAPDHPVLLLRRGVAAREIGDKTGAVTYLRRAAERAPEDPELLSNFGNALGDVEDPTAREIHLKAARLGLGNTGVLLNAAGYLVRIGESAGALPLIDRALEILPDDASGWIGLAWGLKGDALKALGLHDEAIPATQEAVTRNPKDADRWFNLGFMLYHEGQFRAAEAAFRTVLRLRPDHATALTNLGLTLLDDPEALALHERALERDPELVAAAANRSAYLLCARQWREGWRCWRRVLPAPRENLGRPQWTGERLPAGQRLFLWSDQGFGDVITMLRYLPAVCDLAAEVTVELHPGLGALAHALPPGVDWHERGAAPMEFARHLAIGELPRAIPEIPSAAPYLSARPDRIEAWARRLAGDAPKVGLVWAGNPNQNGDRLRSRALGDFAALFRHAGIAFHSLQVGAGRDQIRGTGLPIVDLADELTDFGETAAALSQMDLLISTDTSVLNLAGAMGRPTWAVISPNPDWRWGFHGETTPWYPSLRLFRRGLDANGDAEPAADVMARLSDAFAQWVADRGY